ncbi:MAG: 50S ribosomal protein L28 [Chlamydiales bacterium]
MSRKCQVTGKRPTRGRTYTIRGIAKKKKGIGLKITGKNQRVFQPNVRTKRFWFPDENRYVRIKLSAAAMRTIDKKGIAAIVKDLRSQGITV